MSMNTQIKKNISKSFQAFYLPEYDEIPDSGLYLEQTVQYINNYLQIFPDLEITSYMVSNYVKKGLISRATKKLYSREQISYLIFIAFAKNVLSMENIQLFIDLQKDSYDARKAYEYFRLELINILEYVFGIKKELDTIGQDHTSEKYLLRDMIIAVSHKVYLEKIFSEIAALQNGKTPQ